MLCLAIRFFGLILLFAVFLCGNGEGAEMPGWIKKEAYGGFRINSKDHIRISVVAYDVNWKVINPSSKTMAEIHRKGDMLKANFSLSGGKSVVLEQTLTPVTEDSVSYRAQVESLSGEIELNDLSLSVNLPVSAFAQKSLIVDGEKVVLPKENTGPLLSSKQAKRILIPFEFGYLQISGDYKYLLQDNRKYGGNSYTLRLQFTPGKGKMTRSSIAVQFALKPYESNLLDISKAANMGFRDDTALDGKGGWTDQGPDNDLRMIKPGRKMFSGIPFDVIAPQENNGKSCIVLGGEQGKAFAKEALVNVGGKSFSYLYFLHGAAWASTNDVYATVDVRYEDGSVEEIDIKGKRDVGDWWGAFPVSNGAVVWTAENRSNYIGLYMSKFKIPKKPVKEIVLKTTGKAVWMVAGMTGVDDDVALPFGNSEYYIVKNKDWQPLTHSLEVEKGSALDMSFLVDAPAGKYGRVIVKDGKFAFADVPDKAVRFYGSNLCFTGNYLKKEECEKLAENFARYGYNSVRIHHHDHGMIDPHAPDSLTIDKEQLDKLDYLFYCMKERGIYITTDLYVSRELKPSESGIYDKPNRMIKALVPSSEMVMDNMKAFSKKWLEHVNPYTGVAWKDDPALYSFSLVNENTLYSVWKSTPEVRAFCENELAQWVKKNKVPYTSHEEREVALSRFLTELQTKSYKELSRYVRDEIGCKALFSDCNMNAYLAQQIARSHFDYVDNHGYWDHPSFPVRNWSMPYGFHNLSVLGRYCRVPADLMPTRIFGKPFTFTEYNYVFPNVYRSEGSPVMGAYAALQGWDAVYRFAFSHSRTTIRKITPASGFDVATDPMALLGERIVTLMYLRGDVQQATGAVPYLMTEGIVNQPGSATNSIGFGADYRRLGLIHRIGTVVENKKDTFALPSDMLFCVSSEKIASKELDGKGCFADTGKLLGDLLGAKKLTTWQYSPESKVFESDTGEIKLEVDRNAFTVSSPRSECVVLPAGQSGSSGFLSVSDCSTYSTIYTGSLDGKKLAQSSRLLLLHLTDVKNTKTKFSNSNMTLLEKNGVLPHLVRKGTAQIKLSSEHDSAPQVWAIDVTGKRLGEMPWKDGGFIADTVGPFGAVMAYEIIWE